MYTSNKYIKFMKPTKQFIPEYFIRVSFNVKYRGNCRKAFF